MILAPGTILADRYVIGSRLGAGAQAVTYGAVDRSTGEQVVVKELALSRLDEWKPLDLFAREARILGHLQHPRIPVLIDHFHQEDADDLLLYLVTARAPGRSLAARLDEQWQPGEQEVRRIARGILAILEYLQALNPPVIHRDIKPSNLVMDDAGDIYLVDFGAVRDAVRPLGGSTVVGTFGYMAPELFTGQAIPASDLYGLGATLVHLLSGVPPDQIPQRELRLRFRPLVSCSDVSAAWIGRLLEPAAGQRFSDAAEARRTLDDVEAGRLMAADLERGYPAVPVPAEEDDAGAYGLIIVGAMLGALAGISLAYAFVGTPQSVLGGIPGSLLGVLAGTSLAWSGRAGPAGFWARVLNLLVDRIAGMFFGGLAGALAGAVAGAVIGTVGLLVGAFYGTIFGAVLGAPAGVLVGAVGGVKLVRKVLGGR